MDSADKNAGEMLESLRLSYNRARQGAITQEITEIVEHELDRCPNCSGKLIETNVVISDIIDIEIKVTKTRNNIHNYKCLNCRKKLTANDILKLIKP